MEDPRRLSIPELEALLDRVDSLLASEGFSGATLGAVRDLELAASRLRGLAAEPGPWAAPDRKAFPGLLERIRRTLETAGELARRLETERAALSTLRVASGGSERPAPRVLIEV